MCQGENEQLFFSTGGDIDEFILSLNLYGDDLDPDEITSILGIQPTTARRKGDRRNPVHRFGVTTGHWALKIRGTSPTQVEEKLSELLDKLPADLTQWHKLVAHYTAAIRLGLFMGIWNRGFTLSPELTQRLAGIGVRLDFDVYGPTTGAEMGHSFDGV